MNKMTTFPKTKAELDDVLIRIFSQPVLDEMLAKRIFHINEDLTVDIMAADVAISGSMFHMDRLGKISITYGTIDICNIERKIDIGDLTSLPFKFGLVGGEICLCDLKNLDTLEGMPNKCQSVTLRGLDALKTLEHISQFDISCSIQRCTKLTSLNGLQEDAKEWLALDRIDSLTSLEGCSSRVEVFRLSNCDSLISLAHMPRHIINKFILLGSNISLVNISDHLDYVESVFVDNTIKCGGIGLLCIPNFSRLSFSLASTVPESPSSLALCIIDSYAKRKSDIFECQMELIEAGYEAFAQL